MDIDAVAVVRDGVRELPPLQNILAAQLIDAADPARFADADAVRRAGDIGVLHAVDVVVEEVHHAAQLTPGLNICLRKLLRIGRIQTGDAGHIDVGQLAVAAGTGPEIMVLVVEQLHPAQNIVPLRQLSSHMRIIGVIGAERRGHNRAEREA